MCVLLVLLVVACLYLSDLYNCARNDQDIGKQNHYKPKQSTKMGHKLHFYVMLQKAVIHVKL